MMGFDWHLIEGGNQHILEFWIRESLESIELVYLDFSIFIS